MRFKLTRDWLIAKPKWLIVNNRERHDRTFYNIEIMATTPSARKLTPFHVRPKDMNKENATLFYRIHTRKIDALISTLLQV